VVVAGLDLVDGYAPGIFVFDAGLEAVGLIAPPGLFGRKFLDANGLALVVALHARRIGVLVVPDLLRRRAFRKEEEVGPDTGVGIEDTIGQADDGVQVALVEESFLDARLHALAEEGAIGQDDASAAAGYEQLHGEYEEEVGGLARTELGGEVGLDAVLLRAVCRRLRHYH